MGAIGNVTIEPVDALFGAQHLVEFDTIADVAGFLGGKYFNWSTPATDFYIWFDTGSSTDPAIAGKTGVHVTIVSGDSASVVATKAAAAINLLYATNLFHAKATNNALVLQASLMGAPKSASSVGTSTFTMSLKKLGFTLSLGYFESGDVTVGLDESLFEVKAHQTGAQILGGLRTGVKAGPVKLNLIEATVAKLKTFLESGIAVSLTPSESGSTEVSAIGSLAGSKQFGNVTADGGKLVLHPTKNLDTDYSGDMAFWLAYPKLSGLTFSGESAKKIEIEFQLYLNDAIQNAANIAVYGDHTQNFLK